VPHDIQGTAYPINFEMSMVPSGFLLLYFVFQHLASTNKVQSRFLQQIAHELHLSFFVPCSLAPHSKVLPNYKNERPLPGTNPAGV